MVSYLVGILLLAYEFAAVAIFLSVSALWEIFFAFPELSKNTEIIARAIHYAAAKSFYISRAVSIFYGTEIYI